CGSTSPPVLVMNFAPFSTPPRASTTLRTGTPVHSTQPAAPTCQGVPLALWSKNARPLPEHCKTAATASTPSVLSSARARGRDCLVPWIDPGQAPRSAAMASSGAVGVVRTNSLSVGVVTLAPIAARLVVSG